MALWSRARLVRASVFLAGDDFLAGDNVVGSGRTGRCQPA